MGKWGWCNQGESQSLHGPIALQLNEIRPVMLDLLLRNCQFSFHLAWPHPAPFVAMPFATLISALVGVVVLYGIQVILTRKKAPGPLPPGPPGKPILGNIADLPPPGKQDWMHWVQHKTQYGEHSSHCTKPNPNHPSRKLHLSN